MTNYFIDLRALSVLEWFIVLMGDVTEFYIMSMCAQYKNADLAWQAIEALAED